MPRFLLTLQYRGTRYAGWQTQTNATGIQQVIEAALSEINGRSTRIEASGRTDAGVHAIAQRAHVDIDTAIPAKGLILALNERLPDDIRVMAATVVTDDFHARFNARRKTYRYRIWNDTTRDVFHSETHAWVPGPLDMDAMSEAIKPLVGEHDFQSFTVAGPEVSSTIRTIEAVSLGRRGRVITFEVTANGFLRYMMRRIAGLLIEIGRGRLPTDSMARALEPTFAEARWTAPANGLVLYDVTYADERR